MKLIKDLFTEDDGESWCLARVAVGLALVSFLAFSGYEVWQSKTFKMTEFGTGIMTILTGSAAIIGAKQITTKKE